MTGISKILDKTNPLFEYYAPKQEIRGILSIPHSGEVIPTDFEPYLQGTKLEQMQDLDFRVHELVDIERLQDAGIGVLKANISRITVDLNRSPEKTLFAWKKNSRGVEIIASSPSSTEAQRLIATFYAPYFEMLKALINDLSKRFKTPSIIDLHSMPSQATEYHLKITPNQPKQRPDFCLSDKSGKTCSAEFLAHITKLLSSKYPAVTNNMPYYGGYLTEFIHEERPQGNNIQIEISRALYMNEDTIELIPEKAQALKFNLTHALCEHYKKFSS